MRWFSHPRAATQWYRLLLLAAHGPATSHAPLCIVSGDDSVGFRFSSLVTLTFELGRDFCTLCLTAKFDRPTFSRSEVIVSTNKQTNKQTHWQTNRLRWKHSPRFATLGRWVTALLHVYNHILIYAKVATYSASVLGPSLAIWGYTSLYTSIGYAVEG